jgi:excinuclease ABC subunit A
MTGGEWVVTLRFTVSRNAFQPDTLASQLRLVPFHESETPVLSDADRLTVSNGRGPTQDVAITCHSAADLETPGFESFLARAVASYLRIGKTGALFAASELS